MQQTQFLRFFLTESYNQLDACYENEFKGVRSTTMRVELSPGLAKVGFICTQGSSPLQVILNTFLG